MTVLDKGHASVGVILVGLGYLGSRHLDKLFMMPEVDLVAIIEPCLERRQKASLAVAQHPHTASGRSPCVVATTLQQALEDVTVASRAHMAIVATPTPTHADVVKACLDAGLDVLVEKPMTQNLASATRMQDAAERAQRLLAVGYLERFNPAIKAAWPLSHDVRYIVAERLGPFTGRSAETDVVLDLMVHDLDLVGQMIKAPLVEARAVGVPIFSQAVDMASARLVFADGTVAQLSAGRASLTPCRKMRLFTDARYLSIDCREKSVKSVLRVHAGEGSAWPSVAPEPVEVMDGDALTEQTRAFLQRVAARRVGARIQSPSETQQRRHSNLYAMQLAHMVLKAMKTHENRSRAYAKKRHAKQAQSCLDDFKMVAGASASHCS